MHESDLWVFAYGSLIWRPGFAFAEARPARLDGYRRRFCMTSVHYRGTPERPGLVLALDADPAGACSGLAYRIDRAAAGSVHAYLRDRELVSYAYDERRLPVVLDTGDTVEALAYVTNPDHPQYRGDLSLDEQAEVIARAAGPMGPNADYLLKTEQSLAAHGLADGDLSTLSAMVRARLAARQPAHGSP
jgi:glutathione-specific gamma-glutamylcyclotransferase